MRKHKRSHKQLCSGNSEAEAPTLNRIVVGSNPTRSTCSLHSEQLELIYASRENSRRV
jgi:hypothetical protein